MSLIIWNKQPHAWVHTHLDQYPPTGLFLKGTPEMFSLKRILVVMTTCALILVSVTALAGEKSGYLGVMLQEISTSMAKALQMDDTGGVLVSEVIEDSPAEKAGLKDGDVVLEFNGQSTASNKALVKAVRNAAAGDEVKIKVLRGGKTKTIEVLLGEKIKEKMVWFDSGDDRHTIHMDNNIEIIMEDLEGSFKLDRGFLGVQLDDLNEELGQYFGVEDGHGTLVTKVTKDSGAEEAGLKAGDVIVRLGDSEINSADDLHQAMADTKPEQEVTVQVLRKGKSKKFDVTLGEPSMDSIRKIEIISENGDFPGHAPKMFMKHFEHKGAPHAKHQMERMQFIEEHKMHDLEIVREELESLRLELEELRIELENK
jgi:membrane-associated protease RseP (regulator of RpoE activity)